MRDLVLVDALGERDVELDPLWADLEDVPEAGVAGAEVVDGHLATRLAQGTQPGGESFVVVDVKVLGELDGDAVRVLTEALEEPVGEDRRGRGVDAEAYVVRQLCQGLGGGPHREQLQRDSEPD